MASYYLDSSAAVKLYQSEASSEAVGRILTELDSQRFISRLTVVEAERAFSRRQRINELSASELEDVRFGFYLDALHLAVALDIREREGLDYFVCADTDLCKVAEAEQLSVINPEQSSADS